MDDTTTIVGENVGVTVSPMQADWPGAWNGVSWSAVIAGALTAIAVSIIVIALGSGIGMALVSPYSYSSPSASTMTVIGALWLVFAQSVGFATGGYVAGRLRRPPAAVHDDEVKFRDGANGLVVWAIGVVVSGLVLAAAVDKVGSAASSAAADTAVAGVTGAAGQAPSIGYFTDALLRPNPQSGASTGANAAEPAAGANSGTALNGANGADQRRQINRILLTALSSKEISSDDRGYLAQLVSAQTGLSQADAQHRVDDVINRAKQDATQAAEAARKAAAYVSFWSFMSLLFGAVCATLGGILGGDLRDDFAMRAAVPTSPR
ncbi:MAG: hypothetical protein ABSE22_11740 [Xanthobacteraceae bacterium]